MNFVRYSIKLSKSIISRKFLCLFGKVCPDNIPSPIRILRVHAGVINARVYSVSVSDFSTKSFWSATYRLLYQASTYSSRPALIAMLM